MILIFIYIYNINMELLIDNIIKLKRYYKYQDGTFKLQNGEKIEKPPLSQNTLKAYESNFKKIAGDNSLENLEWLNDTKLIIKKLDNLANTTKHNILNTIIVIIQANAPELKSLSEYIQLRDILYKDYEKKNETGIISDKQASSFITLKQWNKMRSDISTEYTLRSIRGNTSKEELTKLYQLQLLLTLYNKYPVRNELATLKKISIDDYKKLKDKNKGNYLVMWKEKMALYLNEYKTSKTFKTNIFVLPLIIKKMFRLWFKEYNNTDYVFLQNGNEQLTSNNLTKLLIRTSQKYIGKDVKLSTTMIRKVLMSDKYADKNEEQKKDAKKMTHSVETQNKIYVKKPKPQE